MTDEAIQQLEIAALAFAAEQAKVHGSLQEHQEKCALASANLIAAAMELVDGTTRE